MYHLSRRFEKNINVLPLTAGVLETLPEVISMVRGAAKVSVIEGGTHLRPHCGPSNTRMRIHLGLSVPPGCEIRVGNRTRGWAEGRTLAFDDSFEHEVWHRAARADRAAAAARTQRRSAALTGLPQPASAGALRTRQLHLLRSPA